MPADAGATDLAPLFASLQEEAKRAHVMVDFNDSKFRDKISSLVDVVKREYEIVFAFRAFLADPSHVKPFFFPERFDKYRRAAAPVTSARQSFDYLADPKRPSLQEVESSIHRQQADQGDTFQAWLRGRKT